MFENTLMLKVLHLMPQLVQLDHKLVLLSDQGILHASGVEGVRPCRGAGGGGGGGVVAGGAGPTTRQGSILS